MTMRLSTGMQNFLAAYGGYADALNGGFIRIFTGAQPASADAAETGTILCNITNGAAARTAEVLATGTMTLTSGGSGSVDAVTVNGVDVLGGAVPFNGTLSQTATDVAAQINRNTSSPNYTASAVGAVITISALPGPGALANTFVIAASLTTITASFVALAGGVSPVNGLKFNAPVAGVLSERTGQVWSGDNVAAGVAGWFRFYGSVADAGGIDATGRAIRIDGAVSTAGGELNFNNTTFALSANTKIPTGTITIPAQA